MFRNRTAVAVAFAIGILVLGGLVGMSSIGSTTVSAAQIANRGGATDEMLNFALNFRSVASFEQYGASGVRNAISHVESGANAIDPQAGVDLQNAVRAIDQLPCEAVDSSSLGGKTFGPGVYCLASANLAGSMSLDAGGNPDARFVFRVAGDITADANSSVSFENGATSYNAYFVSGSGMNIGQNSRIGGTLVASGDINFDAGANLSGRAMSVKGSVNAGEASIAAAIGIMEICKDLAPGEVVIPVGRIFTYTVTGITGLVSVPAGSCSQLLEVTAGPITVVETAQANVAVVGITTEPAGRLTSTNFATGQAIVSVPAGDATNETIVRYVNQTTRTGSLEICKFALDDDVTGFFNYTVQGVPSTSNNFTVPVGFCSDIITTTIPQVGTNPFTANVTELARDNYRLELVDTTPLGRNAPPTPPGFVPNQGFDAAGAPIANTNGGFTNVLLNTTGTPGMILVNFYNRSLPGRVKVCKSIADARIPTTTQFLFTVTGQQPTSSTQTLPGTTTTQTVAVLPGSCVIVPGTYIIGTPVTVTEVGMNPASFTSGGVTYTFADIRVSLITANPGPLLTSNLVGKTATFTARNFLAEVNFTNFIFRPTILKLCKAAAVASADTTPRTATFSLSLVNPLTSFAVNTNPFNITYSAAGAGCVLLNGPFPEIAGFPGIGTFNLGTQLTVTEAASTAFTLTAITSPTGNTLATSLTARTGTITLNQIPANINEIRFVNAPTVAPPVAQKARFDFDGDGKSDMATFRNGNWLYAASGNNSALAAIQFGQAGDKLVAADYDGDGKTDAAVFRNGTWFVNKSTGGGIAIQFGLATDIPQVGDFDGDGKADFAVFRPSDGNWYMQNSTAGFSAIHFGTNGDRPVAADFDGDGKTDVAVYRGNTWYVMGSTAGFMGMQFGIVGDIPVQADYDGDGKADYAVYRNGAWYILGSTSGFQANNFGMAGDVPVPADYDGDGKTDIAVYRTSTTVWHILQSSQAQSLSGGYVAAQFGSSNDVLMNY